MFRQSCSDAGADPGQSGALPDSQPTVRVCVPLPQEEVHGVHGDACQWQLKVPKQDISVAGLWLPQSASWPELQVTNLVLDPAPQVTEQLLHFATTQLQPEVL